MRNYAGVEDIDHYLKDELSEACITVYELEILKDGCDEVNTSIIGDLHGWSFKRAWNYWIASGPGIPLSYAENFNRLYGDCVRVNGDGYDKSESIRRVNKGFAVGCYHIDTQKGLNAFADLLNIIVNDSKEY